MNNQQAAMVIDMHEKLGPIAELCWLLSALAGIAGSQSAAAAHALQRFARGVEIPRRAFWLLAAVIGAGNGLGAVGIAGMAGLDPNGCVSVGFGVGAMSVAIIIGAPILVPSMVAKLFETRNVPPPPADSDSHLRMIGKEDDK